MGITAEINESVDFITSKSDLVPKIGLILGSGLGVMGDELSEKIAIPYDEIPYFKSSTVKGHNGRLLIGKLEGTPVMIMDGRFHYYEGYDMATVTYPVRVMAKLGIEKLIVTNSAGGCNPTFTPGNLMLITDHINFMGTNPLIGPNLEDFGTRFPDMSEAYDREFLDKVQTKAKKAHIDLKQGVYMGFSGPTYETPAEVRFAQIAGASAVGMSTVPEVIVAKHSGLKVLGISCITNLAAGLQFNLNHEEVVETTERVKEIFKKLVRLSVKTLTKVD